MIPISSRYSLKTISPNIYQQFLTGTTTPILLGNKSLDPLVQGYVYVPYIMVQDRREWEKQKLKETRIEKLQKIKNITI